MKKIIFLTLLTFQSFLSFSQDPIVYFTNGGNGYSTIEGNSYTFSVNLYSASATDVIVDVSTIDVSADATDYTPIDTTVTIPAGQLSSNTLTINTANDNTIEGNENFRIEGTITSGNTSNNEVVNTITIWDNDETPTVYISNSVNIVESYNKTVYVSLSNYFNTDVTIEFSTTAGTADTSDFVPTTSTITIPAGQRQTTFPIVTQDDTVVEADETYNITATVTSGNATNNTVNITVTIIDNDVIPTFSINDSDVYENYNNAQVYARIDRVFNADVVVQLTTTNGTADNSDYTTTTQTRTIAPGYTSVGFPINIIDDEDDEPLEFLNVTATVTSGNTTNNNDTSIVNIIDNDGLPDFYLEPIQGPFGWLNSDSIAAEEGFELKFRPRLRHPSPVDTEITITTTNGTADNSDYTTSTLTTTIPAGQTLNFYEELSYPTILDQLDEDDETLFINAVVTSDNTYNANHTAEAFILDNYAINAQPDEVISIVEVGTTYQLLDNDTFEGLPVVASDVSISLIGNNTVGATIDPSGVLTIPNNVELGYYSLSYEICEAANPASCDTATITILVESPLDVTATITQVDFNGDGYTSAGDTILFEYTVTNNGNAPITDIDAMEYYSTLDIVGGPLASLGAGQTDSTTFTATHVLTQEDINYGYYGGDQEGITFFGTYYGYEVTEWVFQDFYLENSDGIKLNAFVDTNGNGTQENDELNFPLGQFNYEINDDGIIHNLLVSPHYLYESNPTTSYDLNYIVDADYAAYNTTTASYNNVTVPEGSGITTYNFPITVTPYNDLSIEVVSAFNAAVPGFNYYNYLIFKNNSNQTITNGTIEFFMDNALNLLNVSELEQNWWQYNPATPVITATGFTYNFNDLLPYQTRRLRVKMSVPTLPTVSLGQLVTNSATIEILPGEISALNNSSSITQTIVGSYDPNDITEKHGEEIVHSTFTTDDYLTYTIRFENTGTANAINIRVEDVLDDQLDETTLKMVDASHEYSLERVGKNLEWNFYAIQLPPSEEDGDSQVGHGYITFKVKPFPGYQIGDVIPNTAEIYFDFNPAIITNTWTTTFVENLGLDDEAFNSLSVYPNPAKDKLHISNYSIITAIEITSVLGKQVLSKTTNKTSLEVDISTFTSGVYFVKIKNENAEKTIKLIKE
jgi:uncharacterized repeat protein (TIGR01451 family)